MSRKKAQTSSDFKKVLQILKKSDFQKGLAVERQIAAHVRGLIDSGDLAPGTRFPPIRILAELWSTNYFTVHSALRRVLADGKLTQSPKLGTFVAEQERKLRCACLYHDHDLAFGTSDEFYSKLNLLLYKKLAERGVQVLTYFDHRERFEMIAAPKELMEHAREGRIDAIIATSILPRKTMWLPKLGIPYASLGLSKRKGRVMLDHPNMFREAMQAVADAGKRSVGFIHSEQPPAAGKRMDRMENHYYWLELEAKKHNLRLVHPAPVEKPASMEEQGFLICENFLRMKKPPEALIAFTDIFMKGAAASLLNRRVKVPGEVFVVSHRNAESPIFIPFPVTWLTVEIEAFATAFMEQILEQFAGNKPLDYLIPCKLEADSARAANISNALL